MARVFFMTAILGISARYHDSAAALLVEGRVIAAAQEERFSRKKHDNSMPVLALRYCLAEAGLDAADLDAVVFYEKPLRRFERMLETWLAVAPRGYDAFRQALPSWIHDKLHLPRELAAVLGDRFQGEVLWIDHHQAHAASAFFPSPFESAAILTLDGVGEWATGSYGRGQGNRIYLTHETRFPHSLGLLYSAFTAYLGFRINSGEYKVMGLAPYGRPRFVDQILDHLVDLHDDGSFYLDPAYFTYCHGLTMTSERFHRLFGGAPRDPESPLTERHMDLAASLQRVTEEIVLRSARHVQRETGERFLVLAGGVALNCVANGRIFRELAFEDLWIQPAAGDAGGALGAVWFAWHQLGDRSRDPTVDRQLGSYLGPSWTDEEIRILLEEEHIPFRQLPDEESLAETASAMLTEGKVIGWFQGRMEFGPRALGHRSILGDPRRPDMQETINRKIKYRESFRPFAPAVLDAERSRYFELDRPSPFMLLTAPVAAEQRTGGKPPSTLRGLELLRYPRSTIPAVTHIDGSARVQTVGEGSSPRFLGLLRAFREQSGCPVLVNTSFNVRGEPIVCTPIDAYRCFLRTRMDAVILGRSVIEREQQRALVLGSNASRRDTGVATTPRASSEDGPWSSEWIATFLRCDRCGGRFERSCEEVRCKECAQALELGQDGVLDALGATPAISESTDKIGAVVRRFYEENPFPHYDGFESVGDLLQRASRSKYAAALDRQLPAGSRILEVGCGTGQLGAYLSAGGRAVVGVDFSRASLRLGAEFARDQGLKDFQLLRADLFRLPLVEDGFDLIICKGVLHHTADPGGGLEQIVRHLRPGGHLIVGLYNRLARLPTVVRSLLYRISRRHPRSPDYVLRHLARGDAKTRSWFLDQYAHPHESRHGVGEVLGWLAASGLELVSAAPPIWLGESFDASAPLFGQPRLPSRGLELLLVQIGWLFSISREGALFDLIARKPP